jgi:hypothetical protein
MKKYLWIALAVIAVAALVLLLVLPRGGKAEGPKTEFLTEEGLPLDTGSSGGNAGAGQTGPAPEASPNIDPGTGMELEQDELPIATP